MVDGGIKWLETCGSTNDEARRLEAAGSIDTIVAFHQTKGRGRLARQWHSPPLSGLYLSWVTQPCLPLEAGGSIPLLAAIATAELCRERGVKVQVKWPNDVLVDDAKLAGILCEARSGTDGWTVVVGIGLNVLTPAGGWPKELNAIALDSLVAEPPDRHELAVELRDRLRRELSVAENKGLSHVIERWLQYGPPLGTMMRRGDRVGRFAGLSEDGSLRLETSAGIEIIHSGDVDLVDKE